MAEENSENPYQTPEVEEAPAPAAETYARPEFDVADDEEEGPPDAELIEVASVLTLAHAELLRAALRGSGIRTWLRGGHATQVLGDAAGVKVMVEEPDYERAKDIADRKSGVSGRPIFMVVGRPFGGYAILGFMGGGFVGMIFGKIGGPLFALLFTLLGIGIGLWRAAVTMPFCASPECGASMSIDDKTCPGCGGTVRGTIQHANERLAAEEKLASGE